MKKFFTLIAVAAMAMTAGAQEVGLFDYSAAYEDGQSISTASAKLTLGNDMKGWKVGATKITEGGYLNAFGQTVTVSTDDGDKEQFSAITLNGQNNPKDEAASGKGSGINCAEGKTSAHLPQNGSYYIFQPTASGTVQIGIVLNANKAFYLIDATDAQMVHDDSKDKDYLDVVLPDANLHNYVIKDGEGNVVTLADDEDGKGGKIVNEKINSGTLEFDAEAGKTYYFFCTGSKLGCFGYVFNAASTPALNETTLWEGTATVTGWANQPYILSDGGAELKAANAKAGDLIRIYMSAPTTNWQMELFEGHWGPMYLRFSEVPLYNEDGSARESVISDLTNKGYVEFALTEDMLTAAYTSQGWGGTFLLNGDGDITVTKVTILNDGGSVEPQPQGEKESLIDRFTYTWNDSETLTHNEDGSITYNSVSWGGLAAWLKGETEPTDWSGYEKIVFEFAEPTTVNTQILIGGTDATAWGNAGITSLECLFEGHDMTNVEQCALQTSEATTLVITAIYLVKKADGIQQTVSVKNEFNANAPIYNLAGVRVNKDYKGIVIQNGKKFVQK